MPPRLPSHLFGCLALAASLGLAPSALSQGPVIGGFTPQSGPPGTLVKIVGSDLAGPTRVLFGGMDAASFWVVTDQHIKAYVPEDAESGPIIVVAQAGIALSREAFIVVRQPAASVRRAPSLSPARPNPSRGPVAWTLDLPRRARVRFGLFDLQGRAVRELVHGVLPAGSYERTWDRRDRLGHAVPPGIYVARLEVDDLRLTRRAVVR